MNKIYLTLATFVAFTVLGFTNAYADIACPAGGAPPCQPLPGTGGGGCSIAADHPATLALVMITVGLVAVGVGRRRSR
jgi:hypothetical protein